jgi:hypothetical protein
MSHDITKVILGQVPSSDKVADVHAAAPASFPAGLVVCKKSDGALSLAHADGEVAGVSLGKSLMDTDKTAVCRVGNDVPVRVRAIHAYLEEGDLTFTAVSNLVDGEDISIEMLDTDVAAGAVVTVVGTAISVSIEDGVTTATTIKTALDNSAAAAALITTAIADGEGASAQDAFVEANLDDYSVAFVAPGAIVYVDDETGEACEENEANAQATGAFYKGSVLTGIAEDGSEHVVALIDMGGGL